MELIAEYGAPGVSVQLADVPAFVTDQIPEFLVGIVLTKIVCDTGEIFLAPGWPNYLCLSLTASQGF